MPMVAAGIMNADTSGSATASAAFCGTTMVIPFAARPIGMKLPQVRPRIGLPSSSGMASSVPLCNDRPKSR